MSYTKHKKQVLIWIMAGLAAATLVSGALGGCSGETAKATPTPTRTSVPAATLPPTDTPLPTLTPTPERVRSHPHALARKRQSTHRRGGGRRRPARPGAGGDQDL